MKQTEEIRLKQKGKRKRRYGDGSKDEEFSPQAKMGIMLVKALREKL